MGGCPRRRPLARIASLPESADFYGGLLHEDFVWRDGKWAVPQSVFAETKYPIYAKGGGYVLSRSAAHRLAVYLSRLLEVYSRAYECRASFRPATRGMVEVSPEVHLRMTPFWQVHQN